MGNLGSGQHSARARRAVPAFVVATVLASLTVSVQAGAASADPAPTDPITPIVMGAVAFGESQPVSDLPVADELGPDERLPLDLGESEGSLVHPTGDGSYSGVDPALQPGSGGSGIPSTSVNFEGIDIGESSSDGVFVGAPPDTNGDVGPNHYVETVNTVFAIYDKAGTRVAGPTPMSALWKSAPDPAQFNCAANDRGDPIVQYDPLADRWLLSQFNFPGTATILPPFDQCIAISQTADPTGAYWLYDFHYSDTLFNDYPHFGVWPDGYYMSVNQFEAPNFDFHSGGACAFERPKMLVGDPTARQVCFDESQFDPGAASGSYVYGGQLPSDLDGTGVGASFSSPPPAGEPNFFMQFVDSTTAGADKLLEFKFKVDWTNPLTSTFGNGQPGGEGLPIEIPVADFSSNLCDYNNPANPSPRDCLPQKDSPDGLDPIPDRLMYRLAYRNFGDHESIVANHTVDVGDAAKHAGIRWYELRDPNGAPTVHQQSTYAPDGESRWMGSAAMDQNGNIALGYSLTSTTRNPAIAYTARQAGDPLGQMSLGEAILFQGVGAQLATDSRWGDYSSMSIDPDGCTFWYAQEHYLGTAEFNWGTRIGAFSLPVCGDPALTMSASVPTARVRDDYTYTLTVAAGQDPVQGAVVSDTLPSGLSLVAVTPSQGSCTVTTTVDCALGDLASGGVATIDLEVHANAAGVLTNTATLTTVSPDASAANNTASVDTTVSDPCAGVVLLTDPTGDAFDFVAAHDIQQISVAEPWFGPGADKLAFTLKVADLSTVPPNTTWPVTFFWGTNASNVPQQWFVAMRSDPLGTVAFRYGTGSGSTSGIGALDAESGFAPDGTITLVVSNSKLLPVNGGPPVPGSHLTGFLTRIRAETGTGSAVTPDNAPDSLSPTGDYPLSGNAFCAPNTAPAPVLTASPTSGSAPLSVDFDGSGSSDPDAGDSVATYRFSFGDGTPPVSQPGPAVSHTYSQAGTYHATLTVTDSHGLESASPAGIDIVVSSEPSADMSVDITGPTTAVVGEPATYTGTVHNAGPDQAEGVTATYIVPRGSTFGSATPDQGSCSAMNPDRTVVCALGSIASGDDVVITFVINPVFGAGRHANRIGVKAVSPPDPDHSNNSDRLLTTFVKLTGPQ